MLPNFIVVGASKSGTSSLGQYLNQHPDVFLPAAREPHHFAPAKWGALPAMPRDAYERLFDDACGQSAVGEISTGYLYYQESPQRIHRHIPACRIVAVIRNPVERAFSGYMHERRDGMENVSFEAALDEERSGSRASMGFGFQYLAQGFVHDRLAEYIGLFGRENTFVGLFDDLRADPGAFMANLFGFLNVDPAFIGKWDHTYNRSGMPASARLNAVLLGTGPRVINKDSAGRRIARNLFSQRTRTRIWHFARDLNVRLGSRPELRPDTRATLQAFFRDEVRRLETLLDQPLPGWHTPE